MYGCHCESCRRRREASQLKIKPQDLDFYSTAELQKYSKMISESFWTFRHKEPKKVTINGVSRIPMEYRDELMTNLKRHFMKEEQKRLRSAIPKEKKMKFAIERLTKDLKEINSNKYPTVHALPLKKGKEGKGLDLFKWHVNLLAPSTSRYHGICMHMELEFDEFYPVNPPKAKLFTRITHSHVFPSWICLDLLGTHGEEAFYFGWSSVYSVGSILQQLQSFLLEEEDRYSDGQIEKDIKDSLNFKCTCEGCQHTVEKPYPWHEGMILPTTKTDSNFFKNRLKNRFKNKYNLFLGNETETKKLQKYLESDKKVLIEKENLLKALEMTKKSRRKNQYKIKKQKSKINKLKKEIAAKQAFLNLSEKKFGAQKEEKAEEKKEEKIEIEKLPEDALMHMMGFLKKEELSVVKQVNKEFQKIADHPFFWENNEIKCFYSKRTFHEDVIGIGINIRYSKSTNKILSITSPLDMISQTAFKVEKIRFSAWKHPFTHFLPLYIHENHWERAFGSFKKLVVELYYDYSPENGFDLLLKLMSSLIVTVCKGELHASFKALQVYGYCFRMMIELALTTPKLLTKVNTLIARFIDEPRKRTKQSIHSLGEFIPCVAVSNYNWEDIKVPFVTECCERNCPWIKFNSGVSLDRKKGFSNNNKKKSKLTKALFDATKVSNRLVMFQKVFLTGINVSEGENKGQNLKEIAEQYDKVLGRNPIKMNEILQNENKKIQKIDSLIDYFEYVGFKMAENDDAVLKFYKERWNEATNKGYFGRINSGFSIFTSEKQKKGKKEKEIKFTFQKDLFHSENQDLLHLFEDIEGNKQ